MGVMEHIITEGEEEAYQSEIQYRNAQSEFKRLLKSAEGWRKFEFLSSILGMLALVALIIIAIFRSCIVESIILGLAVMDEYKFINPSAPTRHVLKHFLYHLPTRTKFNFNHPLYHKIGETRVWRENKSSPPK